MAYPAANLQKRARSLLRPTNIPAVIAAVVVVIFGVFADRQNTAAFQRAQRDEVLDQVSLIRARLEGNIKGDVRLCAASSAPSPSSPQMSQARFAEIAASLLESGSEIRNIAGAPDLVVSLVYPMHGQRKGARPRLSHERGAAQRGAAGARQRRTRACRPGRPGAGRAGLRRPVPGLRYRRQRRKDVSGASFRR